MRFLTVSSPHGYTTRDVWMRVMSGLRANGAEVVPYDLLPRWQLFDAMLALMDKHHLPTPEAFKSNLLAYEPVLGASHYHECDAVIVVSPQYCPTPLIDTLRKSGKKTIGYFTECPYEDTLIAPQQAAHFDYVFVNDRNSVELYRSFCERVFYLPHSYDPAIHFPPEEGAARNRKIVFIGTGYPSRREFFEAADWSGIDLELYGLWWMPPRWMLPALVRRKTYRPTFLGSSARLRRYLKGDVVENEKVADLYRRSAGSICIHRTQRYVDVSLAIDDGEAYSVGPRTWELAATETFQVSDYRAELLDIFADAVPIYNTPEELTAILRRAIADPIWRQEQARRQREAVAGRDCHATMAGMLEAVA